VGLSGILLVVAIQVAALLVPIAAGLAGVISGGLAGLASIVAWAGLGVPASYTVIDRIQAIRRTRRSGLAAVVTLPSAHA
jgi:hypothetical protein